MVRALPLIQHQAGQTSQVCHKHQEWRGGQDGGPAGQVGPARQGGPGKYSLVNSLKLFSHWSILLIPERPRGLLQALLQEEGRDQLQDHQDQGDAAPGQRGAVHCQGGPQGLLDTIHCQDPGRQDNRI